MLAESRKKVTPIKQLRVVTAKNKQLPRMRTIAKAAEEVGIAVYLVRKLVKEEKIIFVKSGCKSYVNLDSLINYLNTGDCAVKTN